MENIFDIMPTAETNPVISDPYINKFENDRLFCFNLRIKYGKEREEIVKLSSLWRETKSFKGLNM